MKLDDKLKSKIRRLSFSITPFDAWVFAEAVKQLPEDAVIGYTGQDHVSMRWSLYVISEKFEEVPEGQEVPEILCRANSTTRTVELVMPVGPMSFLSELESL